MQDAVNGGVGEQESFALASVLLFEDAGALESNGESSDELKRRGRYHITPTLGKIIVVGDLTLPQRGECAYSQKLDRSSFQTIAQERRRI